MELSKLYIKRSVFSCWFRKYGALVWGGLGRYLKTQKRHFQILVSLSPFLWPREGASCCFDKIEIQNVNRNLSRKMLFGIGNEKQSSRKLSRFFCGWIRGQAFSDYIQSSSKVPVMVRRRCVKKKLQKLKTSTKIKLFRRNFSFDLEEAITEVFEDLEKQMIMIQN